MHRFTIAWRSRAPPSRALWIQSAEQYMDCQMQAPAVRYIAAAPGFGGIHVVWMYSADTSARFQTATCDTTTMIWRPRRGAGLLGLHALGCRCLRPTFGLGRARRRSLERARR